MLDDRIVEREMRRLRRMAITFGACTILSCVWTLYAAYIATQLGRLTGQYGWGHIPRRELPLILYQPLSSVAYVVITIIRLVAAAAFLSGGATIHRVIVAISTTSSLRWSWRWTLASCFIPIVNLVRPWLGFAELHQRAFQLAAHNHQTKNRRPRRLFTWAMAAMITLTGLTFVVSQAIHEGIARDIRLNIDPTSHYFAFSAWLILEAVLIAVTGWMMLRYLWRARQALLAAITATQVDIFG